MKVIGYRHTGLIVKNLQESLNFYEKFLNLTVIQMHMDDTPYIARITGIDNLKAEYAKLLVPGGAVIELLSYPSHPEKRVERMIHQPGEAHLAFQVDSIESSFASVLLAGIPFLSEPVLSSEKIAKVFFLLDPDGYRVELVEMLTDNYSWKVN